MINVYVVHNGSVAFCCSRCETSCMVDIQFAGTPWWELYVGRAVLQLLGHYLGEHEAEREKSSAKP